MPKPHSTKGYLIPEVIDPPDRLYICVPVPNDRGHIRAFLGQIDKLAWWNAWDQDGTENGKLSAAVWKPIIEELYAKFDGEVWCDVATIWRVEDCALQFSTDAGQNWTTAVDLSACTVPGPKGDKGDKGDTGEQGLQGPQGITGDTGVQGEQGITGDTGPKGDQGDKGDKGDTGDTGPRGFAGADGATGSQGPTGPQGDPGEGCDTCPPAAPAPDPRDLDADDLRCNIAQYIADRLNEAYDGVRENGTSISNGAATFSGGVAGAALLLAGLSAGASLVVGAVVAAVGAVVTRIVADQVPALTLDQKVELHCNIYCALPSSCDITQAVLDAIAASIAAGVGYTALQADTLAHYIIPVFMLDTYRKWAIFGVDEPSNCAPCDCTVPCSPDYPITFREISGAGTMDPNPDADCYWIYTSTLHPDGNKTYVSIAAHNDVCWYIADAADVKMYQSGSLIGGVDYQEGNYCNAQHWVMQNLGGHCHSNVYLQKNGTTPFVVKIRARVCPAGVVN